MQYVAKGQYDIIKITISLHLHFSYSLMFSLYPVLLDGENLVQYTGSADIMDDMPYIAPIDTFPENRRSMGYVEHIIVYYLYVFNVRSYD